MNNYTIVIKRNIHFRIFCAIFVVPVIIKHNYLGTAGVSQGNFTTLKSKLHCFFCVKRVGTII